jgi:sugar (pentulose or hexulose) kinase
MREDIIIGSASTTGALRRWRRTRKKSFHSRMIQCLHISEKEWVELIPFNNVGSSFNWLVRNFFHFYKDFLLNSQVLDIDMIEDKVENTLHEKNEDLSRYLKDLPIFFPYIEGEPRGPKGRGNIQGGFVRNNKVDYSNIDLYIALVLGICFMFRHNFEILFPEKNFTEIRLTGLIARKSRLFLQVLATLININVRIMKKEQSVAWATGMRSLESIGAIESFPNVEMYDPIKPGKDEFFQILDKLYREYLKIYENPERYSFFTSEQNIL